MKTSQIKTIEQKLEMWHSLGVAGYFSDEAVKLRQELRELQQKEFDKQIKLLLCQQQSS